jgi:hypothetical protein
MFPKWFDVDVLDFQTELWWRFFGNFWLSNCIGLLFAKVGQNVSNLLKLFGIKLLTLFGKLDILIAMQQILFMFVKWASLQKLWVNLCQNSFIRSIPGHPVSCSNSELIGWLVDWFKQKNMSCLGISFPVLETKNIYSG